MNVQVFCTHCLLSGFEFQYGGKYSCIRIFRTTGNKFPLSDCKVQRGEKARVVIGINNFHGNFYTVSAYSLFFYYKRFCFRRVDCKEVKVKSVCRVAKAEEVWS